MRTLLVSCMLTVAVSSNLLLSGCSGGGDVIPPFTLQFSIAIGDVNGDGRPDLALADTFIAGPPPHPGHAAVILQDPGRPGSFFPALNFATGSDPVFITIGDLNGDGLPDLVVANSNSHNVSILLQDPNHPGSFLPAKNYATGRFPNSIAIGDLNGDGRPDLAIATSGPGAVSILIQGPSLPGSFFPATTLLPGSTASSVAIGDLNSDGKLDIAVANAGNDGIGNVFVLMQDPASPGAFLPAASFKAGLQPISIAIGDLNGDGSPDLAVANLGSPSDGGTTSVSVILQNPLVPGNFLAATNYPTGFGSQSVAIGDLNGDGRLDLAVANAGSLGSTGSISVLLQDPANPGTYLTATNYPGRSQPLSVAIGDLNGDGKPDLAVADGGASVLFQDQSRPGNFFNSVLVGQ